MVERTGDPFRAFYDRALPEVYGYLLTRLGDSSAAEGATRDTFKAIVPQWPLPANVKYEVAFAVGFARRRLVDEYRRQDQQVKRRRQFAETSSSAAAHRTTAAVDLRVHWAMVAVPGTQRAAIVLRHVDDLSLRETAADIGRAPRVAEFLIRRGTRTLRHALKKAEQTDGFDPLAAMKALHGPVQPPEAFKEELYDELRLALDQAAVGAPEPEEGSQVPLHRIFLIAAIALASLLLLGRVMSAPDDLPEGPDRTVEPLPLSEPDPPEHNPDPAVISPTTSRPPGGQPTVQPIRPPAERLGGYQFGGWNVLPASEFDGRTGAAVAWIEEQLFVWGGELSNEALPGVVGGILDPSTNVWFSLPPAPIAPHSGATALWTGSEVLIVGGGRQEGAAYSPQTRLWRQLPIAPIPVRRVAVWTGTEALLFGGWGRNGLALDVAENTWRALPEAPDVDWDNSGGVWSGTELIVWGDPTSAFRFTQGLATRVAAYDPATDAWRQFAPPTDDIELAFIEGIWTGEEIILWGIDVTRPDDDNPQHQTLAYRGVALNPATEEWRPIAPPPSPKLDTFWGSDSASVAWTGSRMLVWQRPVGASAAAEIWAYDPSTDHWERGASSPIASDSSLVWAGDTLYAYGGGDRLLRTLSLHMGRGGDELPAPVGTTIVIESHEALPFQLLAIATSSRRAAVVDLTEGITTVYEPDENFLPADAIEWVTGIGDGWVTSASGVVWLYPNGVASQPFVLQSEPSVVRDGVAPSAYVTPGGGDQYSGWAWIVEPGFGDNVFEPPTQIHRVIGGGVSRGEIVVAGTAYPVASADAGLLLNADGKMVLVEPGGSVRELWGGFGLGLSSLGRVAWLECDVSVSNCRVRVSPLDGPESDDLTVETPGATFGSVFQPGVSQVSPDGVSLVIESQRLAGADSTPAVLLVNLRDGSVVRLADGPLETALGPSVVWSDDSEWVLLPAAGPIAIRIADGFTVELDDAIPADMQVLAVASR